MIVLNIVALSLGLLGAIVWMIWGTVRRVVRSDARYRDIYFLVTSITQRFETERKNGPEDTPDCSDVSRGGSRDG